jgi:hypothetical protein
VRISSHFLNRAISVFFVAAATLFPAPADAQQQLLNTQDPTTIGTGNVLLRGEFSYATNTFYPLSGLTGNLSQLPIFGINIGLGPIADLVISGGPYDRLTITGRAPGPFAADLSSVIMSSNVTNDVDDISIGTRITIVPEASMRPAVGFSFSVRLPNAKHPSGLGQDTTDFSASMLSGKSIGVVRVLGNLGFTIMSEPTNEPKQNDVLTYGAAASLRVASHMELVTEVNGRWSVRNGVAPIGTESRGRAQAGGAYTRGHLRYDAAVFVGLTPIDPSFGVSAGLSVLFHAFTP